MSDQFVHSLDYNSHTKWSQLGLITSAQAALGVTARTNAAVEALAEAKKVICRIPPGTVAYQWRFRTDGSEDDAPVLQLYGEAADDHYSRVATLTLSQGTQEHSTGIYFCDTITATVEAWFDTTLLVQPAAPDDHISSYGLNTYGYANFLLIASTLAVTTIYVDGRQLP